jgi:SAM-dependent methyltransferase
MSAPGAERPVPSAAVVWHDLECGAYRADLPLWLGLAAEGSSPGRPATVLDIGSGTGRVALALAHAGHPVSAVDLDPELIEALGVRATGLPVTTTIADARTFQLQRTDHDLGLVPMQTLQLLRGAEERQALLGHARDHLRPGALLALAIVTDVDIFDSRSGGLGPTPEHVRVAGELYVSRAIRVSLDDRYIRIERERFVEHAGGDSAFRPELDVIELERLTPEQLHEEAVAVGLQTEPTVLIGETEEHAGSEVVVLRV